MFSRPVGWPGNSVAAARKRLWIGFIPHHLSGGPRVAGQVEQEANRDFHHVEDALEQADAAAARAAVAHSNPQLADSEADAAKKQDDLGLGVILGIPVGKREDHLSIGGPETTRAVGQIDADQGADDAPQDEAPEPPHE